MPLDPELEAVIQEHCAAQRWDEATTAAVEGYGPELAGYLVSLARNEADAADAFADLCTDIWRGIKNFRWDSAFRTWAYRLAHNAFCRFRRVGARRPERNIPLSDAPQVLEVVDRVRTTTAMHVRTEVKSEVEKLREQLSDTDRALLVLRVDRKLSWGEIAEVMADESDDPSAASRPATLRKRFERAKNRLRKLAEERGLI